MLNDTGRVSDCHASVLWGRFVSQSLIQIDRQWHIHSHTETTRRLLYILHALTMLKGGERVYASTNIPECVNRYLCICKLIRLKRIQGCQLTGKRAVTFLKKHDANPKTMTAHPAQLQPITITLNSMSFCPTC